MRLSPAEIEQVMGGNAAEPVRVVIPRDGTVEERCHGRARDDTPAGCHAA